MLRKDHGEVMSHLNSTRRGALGIVLPLVLLLGDGQAFGGWRDCGQPSSTGANPTSTDARTVLLSAVGAAGACDSRPCACDVSGDGNTTANDALRTLKFAVGQDIVLDCDCPPFPPACTSATLEISTATQLDAGWTGIQHDKAAMIGATVELDVVSRCSSDASVCDGDDECPDGGTCTPTCDCNSDPSCELTGPTEIGHCEYNFAECTTNGDCALGIACVALLGPPLPLSSGGTPVCVVNRLDGPVTGTADAASGDLATSLRVKSRVHLGIAADKPCPACGTAAQNPQLGGNFTCSGGAGYTQQGLACNVDAVSPEFGGTSFDCPPSGSGLGSIVVVPLHESTTGTSTRTAQLPCAASGFKNTPLRPVGKCFGGSSNGNDCTADANCLAGGGYCNRPKCLDKVGTGDPLCTSNSDCLRCTLDSTISCANNGDCSGSGTCGEAPDQPITCGYWCQCGFCDNDPSQSCMQTSDCPEGKTCQVGTGINNAQNTPQQMPNHCSGDKFICGEFEDEKCGTTESGKCSLKPYFSCQEGSNTCENQNGGVCDRFPTPCFGPRITRSGSPSRLGSYCALGTKACATNADCDGPDNSCIADSSVPETVAVMCLPATPNGGLNEVSGITGPAAVTLANRLVFHRGIAEAENAARGR